MGNWKDPEVIALWIWIAIAIALFFVGAILFLVRSYIKGIRKEEHKRTELRLKAQKDLLTNSILVQEKERNRIAADLHDNLVARLQIIRLSNSIKADQAALNGHIQESMQIARRISHELSPPMLEDYSIKALLSDYLEPIKSEFQIQFHCREVKQGELNSVIKLQIFRIFQEMINNCVKHAQATTVRISIRRTDSYFALSIVDNGLGFVPQKNKGMGLKNIESRCQLLEAKHRFSSTLNKGSRFALLVPLSKT